MIAKNLMPKLVLATVLLAATQACQKNTSQLSTDGNSGVLSPDLAIGNIKSSLSYSNTAPNIGAIFPTVYFKSGFESGVTQVPDNSELDDLNGGDITGYDWVNTLENTAGFFSKFRVNYESGTATDRGATILADPSPSPTNPNNKAWRFWLKNATKLESGVWKGRVQGDIDNIKDSGTGTFAAAHHVQDYYQKVRVLLPTSFQNYISAALPALNNSWLTLFEYWDAGGDPEQFRLALNVVKPSSPGLANQPLVFQFDGQIGQNLAHLWTAPEKSAFPVPIDQWFTMEIYIKYGDASNGIVWLGMTPSKSVYNADPNLNLVAGVRKNMYITNSTHSNVAGTYNGMEGFGPMKVYASKDIIDLFQPAGGMKVYWDDFEMRVK